MFNNFWKMFFIGAILIIMVALLAGCSSTTKYQSLTEMPAIEPMPPIDIIPVEFSESKDSFVGLNQDNFNKLMLNFKKLEEREYMYSERLNQCNISRENIKDKD